MRSHTKDLTPDDLLKGVRNFKPFVLELAKYVDSYAKEHCLQLVCDLLNTVSLEKSLAYCEAINQLLTSAYQVKVYCIVDVPDCSIPEMHLVRFGFQNEELENNYDLKNLQVSTWEFNKNKQAIIKLQLKTDNVQSLLPSSQHLGGRISCEQELIRANGTCRYLIRCELSAEQQEAMTTFFDEDFECPVAKVRSLESRSEDHAATIAQSHLARIVKFTHCVTTSDLLSMPDWIASLCVQPFVEQNLSLGVTLANNPIDILFQETFTPTCRVNYSQYGLSIDVASVVEPAGQKSVLLYKSSIKPIAVIFNVDCQRLLDYPAEQLSEQQFHEGELLKLHKFEENEQKAIDNYFAIQATEQSLQYIADINS
ncbi:MAG: hypothetical protein ACPGUD_13890 [Parashewanella sp.]